MNLQPAEAVRLFADRNSTELSNVHRELGDAVAAAFALLESLHPDGRIHGGVLSAVVRDTYLVRLAQDRMRIGQLTAVEGQFRSVRFEDANSWGCRVNMHPKSLKTGRYLSTTPVDESLFGPDMVSVEYDLAVLWRPSVKSKGLRSVCLAAVSDIQDRNVTTIHASAPLPPVDMDSYWQPTVTEQHHEPADDFDDYLPGEEETGDDDPS